MLGDLLIAMIFIKGLHFTRMLTRDVSKLVFREFLLAMIFIKGVYSTRMLTRDVSKLVFRELLLAMIFMKDLCSMRMLTHDVSKLARLHEIAQKYLKAQQGDRLSSRSSN